MTNVVGMGIYVKHLKCFLKLAKPFSIVKRKSVIAGKVRGARAYKLDGGIHRSAEAVATDKVFYFSHLLYQCGRQATARGGRR
jgi:hypothetical protein